MQLSLQCYECKQKFPRNELVQYASPRAKILHNYCPACMRAKQEREEFTDKVCQIFGIKAPGPQIWTERKRLQEKYGYTDSTIINCLDYLYNIKKMKKLAQSLCLITPPAVEEMMQYRRAESAKSQRLAQATNTKTQEYVVPLNEQKTKNVKPEYDPDEWLDD